MAYVDLDKIINVTGGGSGGVYPDVPYPVLAQRIGIFNKPDAWDTDSNGRFGLLGNSVNGICGQNYNFNAQMAIAMDTGIGALSTRVKSYDFSTNIDRLDGGVIKFGLMTRGTNFFNINETSKKIKDVYAPAGDNTISLSSDTRVGNIVAAGGNRYLVTGGGGYTFKSYPIDADNRLLSSSASGTFTPSRTIYDSGKKIIAVVGEFMWISYQQTWITGMYYHGTVFLVRLNSNGTFTEITSSDITVGGSSMYFHTNCGYQQDNTIAYYFVSTENSTQTNGHSSLVSIDLTNTTAVSFTTIRSVGWGAGNFHQLSDVCGYDGTGLLVIEGTDIKRVTAAGFSTSLGTAINATSIIYSDSITKLSSLTDNISVTSTQLNILGSSPGGDTQSSLYDKLCVVYEVLSTQSKDDSFVGMFTNLTTIGETDVLTLSVNGSIVETKENLFYTNGYGNKFTLTQLTIALPSIEVELNYANTLGNDLKLGIGITGWEDATPTLPSNNGMTTGSATTARTAGSDASYIDLTLST